LPLAVNISGAIAPKHFRMLGLKSQLEPAGDVLTQHFASPGRCEGTFGIGLQHRREAVAQAGQHIWPTPHN
jgi:hypothetical protein